jgi:chromate transporter
MTSGSSERAAGSAAEGPPSPALQISLVQLFLGFLEIGLSGFGGVLPWARRIIVERRGWLSSEDFTATLGLCQFLPGPNVVNLAVVIGARHHGAIGALVAAFGLLAAPFVIVVALGALYSRFGELSGVQAALRGMSAVAAGLIIAMGLRMAIDLRRRPVAIALVIATFGAIALARLPLPLVMLILAPLGVALAARRMR